MLFQLPPGQWALVATLVMQANLAQTMRHRLQEVEDLLHDQMWVQWMTHPHVQEDDYCYMLFCTGTSTIHQFALYNKGSLLAQR